MLKKYATSLQIKPKQSTILGFTIAVLHVLAIFACIANSLPVGIKILIMAAVLSSFWFNWRRHLHAPYPYILMQSEARGWELMDAKQQIFSVSIVGSTVTNPIITILHLQFEDRKRRVMIIFRDAVGAEDYRQLRVMLKISSLD